MSELKKDGMIPLNYKFRCANSVMVKGETSSPVIFRAK